MTPSCVHELELTDFRSFEKATFSFDTKQTLLLGANGKGKTNTLEALALLSTGKSFRGRTLSECVCMGKEAAHIEVTAHVDDEDERLQMSILAAREEASGRSSSRYLRNGVKKRKGDAISVLKSVIFRPEDLELVTGSPSVKREFLDTVLLQVSRKYHTALREYEKALRHRNKLILMLRDGTATRRDFFFWDELLIRHGDTLTRERAAFIHFLNLTVPFPMKMQVTYNTSIMSEERLHQYATAEVAAGKTLVGPHKDTFAVTVALRSSDTLSDVASFGSRGQQRMAVLWLKLSQLSYIESQTHVVPILLLDDIFSELDPHNRSLLFSLFANHQVILTSAEPLSVLPGETQQGKIIEL